MKTKNGFTPIVLSGPSGAGKTDLIDYLQEKDSIFLEAPGFTTRPRRPGETGNTDFITLEEFQNYIKQDALIQYAEYNGNYYGTLKSALGLLQEKQVLFNMGFAGSKAMKLLRPDSALIYILPPTYEELMRRMGNRGAERIEIGRIQTLNSIDVYDYLLISYTGERERLVHDFMDIYTEEERGKEKSLRLTKNQDFMRNFYQ